MKSKILFPLLLFSIFINAQNELDKTDKIIDEMCLNFKSTENLNDSIGHKTKGQIKWLNT
ncbi:hypothetical protein SAMN05421682_104290 [Chryseobacterium indoltheticum]|uniref:Uncharacterized protein n=1 Tax=Chryseobacterium indoltheticum TaxID=254 RepID=A0A381FH06_9FLAO|nr:hypothetical protein EG358_13425 [Chryseobacterium indoltheticum]SIQ38169.1 hypothetical protein SAMN05421682_104290 [Chryseobacterium indoltheticum]SUX45849.1 Uncharacterised protein [Chryseobacterium indoltheticum]